MRTLYLANVSLHLLAALLWLGGMLFFAVVGAPALRRVEPPALRAELFRALGERFRTVGWACIAVLLATGTLNLWFAGVLSGGRWADAALWSSRYGNALVVAAVRLARGG